MHDIGKVHTPLEVLNKPGKLLKDEFDVMKRHVVDGAHILRRTPEMPALAPIVAFEHHLKRISAATPRNIGSRKLNLCTMIVSIADVFDALRSKPSVSPGAGDGPHSHHHGEQGSPAFNQVLLKRFVNLMGLFPVGNLVRLSTGEMAVVTAEHPTDPFRPQVKIIADASGAPLEAPLLANTWEREQPWRTSACGGRGGRSRIDRHRSAHLPLSRGELVSTRQPLPDAASGPLGAAETARLTDFARACKAAPARSCSTRVVTPPSRPPSAASRTSRRPRRCRRRFASGCCLTDCCSTIVHPRARTPPYPSWPCSSTAI